MYQTGSRIIYVLRLHMYIGQRLTGTHPVYTSYLFTRFAFERDPPYMASLASREVIHWESRSTHGRFVVLIAPALKPTELLKATHKIMTKTKERSRARV